MVLQTYFDATIWALGSWSVLIVYVTISLSGNEQGLRNNLRDYETSIALTMCSGLGISCFVLVSTVSSAQCAGLVNCYLERQRDLSLLFRTRF